MCDESIKKKRDRRAIKRTLSKGTKDNSEMR